MYFIHGIVVDMKNPKLWRNVSFVVLGIYLIFPALYTLFLAATDSLYVSFFGVQTAMSLGDGFVLIYGGWFMITGIPFLIAVGVTALIGFIIWYRRRKLSEETKKTEH